MLTRQEIVALAKAYENQSDWVRRIEHTQASIARLREAFDRELASLEHDLYSERVSLAESEAAIFNLETKNGNFK